MAPADAAAVGEEADVATDAELLAGWEIERGVAAADVADGVLEPPQPAAIAAARTARLAGIRATRRGFVMVASSVEAPERGLNGGRQRVLLIDRGRRYSVRATLHPGL